MLRDRVIGFGLRTTPAGSKAFIVEARVNGRMRRFTLGRADRLTVHEARGQARDKLAGMARGATRSWSAGPSAHARAPFTRCWRSTSTPGK
jgi:hypothetical protein